MHLLLSIVRLLPVVVCIPLLYLVSTHPPFWAWPSDATTTSHCAFPLPPFSIDILPSSGVRIPSLSLLPKTQILRQSGLLDHDDDDDDEEEKYKEEDDVGLLDHHDPDNRVGVAPASKRVNLLYKTSNRGGPQLYKIHRKRYWDVLYVPAIDLARYIEWTFCRRPAAGAFSTKYTASTYWKCIPFEKFL